MSDDNNEDSCKPKIAGPMYINPNKKYGLILGSQQTKPANPISKPKTLVKPCIFNDDDDDDDLDEDETKVNSKKPLLSVNTSSSLLKKQTQIAIEKALEEDKSVFEYDEIYDELEKEKKKLDPKQKQKNESNDPKYIVGIMKAAAKRKMDYEKIQERKIHKEREAEGDLWSDKEVFVTTAYRLKMEERQKMEEEERRQEQIENLLDVRKQKDLSGFYYSMLKMRTGELVLEEEGEKEKRIEKENLEKTKFKEKVKGSQQEKSYRPKKEQSESEDEEEQEEIKEEKEEHTQEDHIKEEEKQIEKVEFKEPLPKKIKSQENDQSKEEIKENIDSSEKQEISNENVKKLSKEEQRRQRLENLFKKRTVGEKFDKELADYFVRKSQVLCQKNYIEKE